MGSLQCEVAVVAVAVLLWAASSLSGSKPASVNPDNFDIHLVRGLSGSPSVELPCSVDQQNCGEVYYITWSKQASAASTQHGHNNTSGATSAVQQHQQSSSTWTRVYLYTGANDTAPHKPLADLMNRAAFHMPSLSPVQAPGSEPPSESAGPPIARLVIEEPRLRDEALYKCDVTYVKGKCPSISLVRLQMMSLPSRAMISLVASVAPSQSAASDGQLLGPYREQDSLQLVCLVLGGRPAPKSVSWRRVDPAGRLTNLVSSRQVHKPGQPSQVETLLSHQLSRADLGAKFECHVEHEALDGRNQVQVLDEPASLASLQLSGRDSTLDLHPALPPPTDSPTPPESLKQLDSHVFIDLNVGVASVDLFVAKTNRRNLSEPLREGDLVELECVAYNARPAANITWFNGQERIEPLELGVPESSTRGQLRHKRLLQRHQVHQNSDGHTYDTHSFLSIKVSRYENRARIWCNASNGLPASSGGEQVRSLELQVQYAPVVLMEPVAGIQVDEQVFGSEQGEVVSSSNKQQQQQVSIYCIYSANPNQLAAGLTRWFKDGRPLDLASDARLTESHTATGYPVLNIRHATRRDAGSYECQLANALGVSERLASGDQCRLQVNFRPSVRLRLLGAHDGSEASELDTSQELVEPGQSFTLHCDVLEARPNKMEKFHWYRWELLAHIHSQPANLIGVTDSDRFQLPSLGPEFGGSAFACAAFNSLGASDRSNHIELRLSHTPGSSHVRAVSDSSRRSSLLQSGQANPQPAGSEPPGDAGPGALLVAASRQLMLECITPKAGQPAASSWLWFKDGQPLDTIPYEVPHHHQATQSNTPINSPSKQLSRHHHSNAVDGAQDNPISDLEESLSADSNHLQHDDEHSQVAYRNIHHGRYLFISSIQLAHRGNYSCLALNRMGPSREPSTGTGHLQLSVARAPSFVQSLESRTYWPEVGWEPSSATPSHKDNQVELICRVQCEPICQLEWLRNNEPLRLNIRRHLAPDSSSWAGSLVTHQMTQSLIDENPRLNLFKSVESRLKLIFQQPEIAHSGLPSGDRQRADSPPDWQRERRNYLSSTNYTCQSSANTFGGPVRSSTRLMVQYPPERLLISSDDKLSLVEGEPGPRLSCLAEGEPQVQYRWFFLRAPSDQFGPLGGSASGTMASSEALLDLPAKPPSWPSSSLTTTYGAQPEQPPSGRSRQPFDKPPAPPLRGANDIQWGPKELIELTGPAVGAYQPDTPTSQAGSQLNLASAPMHRKQAGHYICEASNWLGRSRQSVFVNVLYKPTCATLHLFSLDSTQGLKLIGSAKSLDGSKPSGATTNDEYSLLKETSEDYIDLRKLLVLAPLLNRAPVDLELPFKDTIFHTILKDGQESGRLLEEPSSNFGTLRSSDALINREPSETNLESMAHIEKENPGSAHRKQDSWHKFNRLLLSFMNSYSRQIKSLDTTSGARSTKSSTRPIDKQQTRRSLNSQTQYEPFDEDNRLPLISAGNSSKNLLTFACVAKDANPINNLTFSWSFGSASIPKASDEMELGDLDSLNSIPLASHSYVNYTIHVMLVKRLDVHASLNPFQFSLVTVNVIVEPKANHEQSKARSKWWPNERAAASAQATIVAPNRADKSTATDVAEMNWEEYIGQMLKCRISNQLGASEVCHANVNLLERWRSRESSSSEFANWRMPAMATKSLLIIGISVCCSLIVLATLFLVATPHLKEIIYNATRNARSKTDHQPATRYAAKEDTNTGSQSTSSQKSSVLGLLGPDSSIQGSSDDDSSARVPVSQAERQHKRVASPMLDLDDAATLAGAHGFPGNHPRSQSGSTYDRPRDLRSNNQQQPALNSGGVKKNSLQSRLNSFCKTKSSELTLEPLSSAESRALANSASSRFLESLKFKSLSKFKSDRITDRGLTTYLNRLDTQHNSASRNLHSKNLSNAETVTTGLSGSFRDAKERLSQRGTPVSKLLAAGGASPSNAHYQHHGAHHPFKRGPSHLINRAEANQFLNSLQESSPSSYLMQLNLRNLVDVSHSMSSGAPAYSNLTYLDPSNIADDHTRQPTWAVDDNLYLSQVNPLLTGRPTTMSRNPLKQQPVFTVEDRQYGGMLDPKFAINNNSYTSQLTPVFYGSSSVANYQPEARPTSSMTFRTSYQQQVMNLRAADQQYHSLLNNRFSMPPTHAPPPPAGPQTNNYQHATTTIDTHLDRMNDVLTNGLLHHNQDPQIAYANTLNRNPYLPIACYGTPTSGAMSPTNKPVEHIYDLNAYATPEQTPIRNGTNTATNSLDNQSTNSRAIDRPRVSQLIQSFNSKAPE